MGQPFYRDKGLLWAIGGTLAIVAVLIPAVFLFAKFGPKPPSKAPAIKAAREERDSRKETEDFIEARLDRKVRHTAEFFSVAKPAGGKWSVAGEVRLTNAFGASIRHDYSAVVEFSGTGMASVVAATIDGKPVD